MKSDYHEELQKKYQAEFKERAKIVINCAEDIYDENTKDNSANIFLTAQYLKRFFDIQYLVDDIDAVKEIFLVDREGHRELPNARISIDFLNTSDSIFSWNGVDTETMKIVFDVLTEHRAFSLKDELRKMELVKLDNAAEAVVSKIFKKDEWGRLDLSRMEEKVDAMVEELNSLMEQL